MSGITHSAADGRGVPRPNARSKSCATGCVTASRLRAPGGGSIRRLTANLVDHSQTPDRISDAVLETLIEMSAESQIEIWHRETGLSVVSLAALYRMCETGAGYRRSRLYGDYEAGRLERERDKQS